MDASEFIRAVMQRLDVHSAAELAERMRWKRGTERTIARWLAGETTPSFDYVIEMLSETGWSDAAVEPRKTATASLADRLGAIEEELENHRQLRDQGYRAVTRRLADLEDALDWLKHQRAPRSSDPLR